MKRFNSISFNPQQPQNIRRGTKLALCKNFYTFKSAEALCSVDTVVSGDHTLIADSGPVLQPSFAM